MIKEYIEAAFSRAKYEIIEDEEPFYAEVPGLVGVWATGKTLEECHNNLVEVLDGWITVRLKRGLSIPAIGKHRIEELNPSLPSSYLWTLHCFGQQTQFLPTFFMGTTLSIQL